MRVFNREKIDQKQSDINCNTPNSGNRKISPRYSKQIQGNTVKKLNLCAVYSFHNKRKRNKLSAFLCFTPI